MQASSSNCKNCGAPPAKLMDTSCAYCGSPFLIPANAPKEDVKKTPESKNSLIFNILAIVLGFGLLYWWATALNRARHDK